MNEDLVDARRRFTMAEAEREDAALAYAVIFSELQHARSSNRTLDAIALQDRLNIALQRRQLAEQMAGGHAGRLRSIERAAMQVLKAELVRDYAVQARALTMRLAELMVLDQRLGITSFDSAGIGGYRIPSYADLRADDSGAIYSFLSLAGFLTEAEGNIERALAPVELSLPIEDTHEHQPVTSADS